MQLSKETEKLLLEASRPGKWVPDEYDVSLGDIMVDWRQAEHADIGIVGIPFDTAVTGRRGCRFGPDSIRNALVFSDVYEPGLDIDLSRDFTVTDFGNIDVLVTDVLGTHARVEQVVTEIFKTGVTPVIIGGDHSLAYPDVCGLLNSVEGDVGVINIDAHLDVRVSHHGEVSSGTPFRRLLERAEKPLKPQHFVELGTNGWLNSRYYMDYCREMGIRVIPCREVHTRGIAATVNEALERVSDGTDAVFLSFDIDALDLAHVPGTNVPGVGGLSSHQALEAVWMIGRHPLCRGIDLVEVAPALDAAGVSSMMASALLMQFMGATKKRRGG